MTDHGTCPACGYRLRAAKILGAVALVCDRCRGTMTTTGTLEGHPESFVSCPIVDFGPGKVHGHVAVADHACGAQSRVEIDSKDGVGTAELARRAEDALRTIVVLHQRRHGCVS